MSALALHGWLPIDVSWQDGQPVIDWCLVGQERLLDPFFEDTVRRLMTRPFNTVFRHRTGPAVLEDWAMRQPGLTPDGFIFHMSRCGSTLVAQMLSARIDSVVLSEASPIDRMLRPPGLISQDDHIRWFRALVSAMGQPRMGTEAHFFIKFDCWHVFSLPLIRLAFPRVPWIFLYRDPHAVMASHLRQRGVQTVPSLVDPFLFGIEPAEAATMPAPAYCARVLAAICDGALSRADGTFINYHQLPAAVCDEILPRFGVVTTPDRRAEMENATRQHSKHPAFAFTPADDAAALGGDSPARAAVASFLAGPYEEMERRRLRAEANYRRQ